MFEKQNYGGALYLANQAKSAAAEGRGLLASRGQGLPRPVEPVRPRGHTEMVRPGPPQLAVYVLLVQVFDRLLRLPLTRQPVSRSVAA